MTTASHQSDSSVIRARVAKFRLAWALGQCPDIDAFLSETDGLELRRQLLTALIVVDLEHRWRIARQAFSSESLTQDFASSGDAHSASSPDAYPLSVYLARFPELRTGELPLELLETAYRGLQARDSGASLEVFLCEFEPSQKRRFALRQRLSRMGTATTSSGAAQSQTASFEPANCAPAVPPRGVDKKPLAFGRYKVVGLVGSGGYGAVFMGHDELLDRMAAIKVAHSPPQPGEIEDEEQHHSFVEEAQRIAKLNHPNIVKVYDVARSDACAWYLVMEYIDGPSFKDAIAAATLTREEIARVLALVARAVHHAHLHNIFHRDLKPSNILLNASGWPYVVDFGMALHARDQRGQAGRILGTPAYMSPEQVRGEGHRLDGRTDVWSLGVTLYEALTGQRPFGGDQPAELFDEILHKDARPLRQLNDDVDVELERICLRCLAKRMRDRYTSAADFAADLEHWLDASGKFGAASATPPTSAPPVHPEPSGLTSPHEPPAARIVPRGLRSFGERDAEFFIALLPGPHARDGLTESLHHWQAAIEAPEPGSQAVCVLYGPSGSGKSSFLRAGVLPRLAKNIHCAIVDAGNGDVEGSLLAALRRLHADLPAGVSLPEACSWVRRRLSGSADKTLLVIDQFEHWLHASGGNSEPLVAALRHCDGTSLQCLITVRSDFWLGTTRFMEQLESPLVEEVNCGRIDLFPLRHARKVLQYFGEAYGCLPSGSEPLSAQQEEFLHKAVAQIDDDGWVVPVRLALLAEILKTRDWQVETLRSLGGDRGIGVHFLEETFDSPRALPAHRRLRRAAADVLAELLPEEAIEIKGNCRTRGELLAAANLIGKEDQFQSVMDMLDRQLRLISPVDNHATTADNGDLSSPETVAATPAYQLTHDYLVPSIRAWLARHQQQSRAGRALLCLERRARQWAPSRESRYLPSLVETLRVLLLTNRSAWTLEQRAMMRSAIVRQATALAAAATLIAALAAFVARGLSTAPLLAFLDAGRPAAERIEQLTQVKAVSLADLRAIAHALESERNDEVLMHGSLWMQQYVNDAAHRQSLPDDDRALIVTLAKQGLDRFATNADHVNDAARANFFDILTDLAPASEVISAAADQPKKDFPKLDQSITAFLANLRLPTEPDAARNTLDSLVKLMFARGAGGATTAATHPLTDLTADQLVAFFVEAFANQPLDYAENSFGVYLKSLPAEEASLRAASVAETIGVRLRAMTASNPAQRPHDPETLEYLLRSLKACGPYLTGLPPSIASALTFILEHPNDFRDGGTLEGACQAAADLHESLGDSGVQAALTALHRLLNNPDEEVGVRTTAAEALGRVGDAAAASSLAAVATNADESAALRSDAIKALGVLGRQLKRRGDSAEDAVAPFNALLTAEGDPLLLEPVVREYSTFASVAEFPTVMRKSMELRNFREGIIHFGTFCAFLTRYPAEARTIVQQYIELQVTLPDPDRLYPPRSDWLTVFLKTPGIDEQTLELAGRRSIVALAAISAEHANADVRRFANDNLLAATSRLELPIIDVNGELDARLKQFRQWQLAWKDVQSSVDFVNGQLEER